MKSKVLFSILFLVSVTVAVRPADACTNASLQGGYGFLITGVNSSGTLVAIIGQITSDGNGNLTGSETISNNGGISSHIPVAGSYSIKTNCTGTAMITPSGLSTSRYSLSVVSTGKQIEMVDSDNGTTESGYALAQGVSACNATTIKGVFGYQAIGFTSSGVPIAFSGQAKLDGISTLTATQVESIGGAVVSGPVSGTYVVNSDCTGSHSVVFNGGQAHANWVIVSGGKTTLQVQTDAGVIVTTTAAKQ
jgi:hypothetical protein